MTTTTRTLYNWHGFICGRLINRYADLSLRKLRTNYSDGYSIPHGCLFEVILCPNYFGAMLEWFGWALETWSLAGLFWFLFSSATFVPRARHNHQWYKNNFLIIQLIEKLWYHLCIKKTDEQIIVKIPLEFPVKALECSPYQAVTGKSYRLIFQWSNASNCLQPLKGLRILIIKWYSYRLWSDSIKKINWKVLRYTQFIFLWATHFRKRTLLKAE